MYATFTAVRAVFGLPLAVLSFVVDPVTVHVHEFVIELNFHFFPVNFAIIIVRNVTSHNKRGAIAKFELRALYVK